MDKYELQRLRDLPIEGVAERLGLRLTQGHKCLCPFHDDHKASLSFDRRRNLCRCFACMDRAMGNIDLVMLRLGLSFTEACRWLADGSPHIMPPIDPKQAGRKEDAPRPFDAGRYEPYFLRPWLSQEARTFLFDRRRLDPRVVAWCRLTSWRDRKGTPWLQIPYYDAQGRLTGVQNRNLDPGGGGQPRFRFPQGSRCGIYNLPILPRLGKGDELWLTEGCSDCWAMLSSGRKAIAIPSATLLSPGDRQLLLALAGSPLGLSFHMYPDRDAPGERLFMQLARMLPRLVHHHLPPDCKDFSEYYLQQSPQPTAHCSSLISLPPKQGDRGGLSQLISHCSPLLPLKHIET